MNKATLAGQAILAVLRSRDFYRFYVLVLLFGCCTLFYYFGELVDFAGWEALRWEFFYSVHDIHRLFFLAPILYAGHIYRVKGALIFTMAAFVVFLPRAFIVSSFPDPVLRMVLFTIIAGIMGALTGMTRNESERRSRTLVRSEKDKLLGILETIEELLARIRVALRHSTSVTDAPVLTAGDLEVDLSKRVVKCRGRTVKLTRTEYELLAYLVSNRGKVLTHRELLHNVWGPEYGEESEYIRTFITQLRRKIEDDPSNPRFIVTEPRIGYRFIEPE